LTADIRPPRLDLEPGDVAAFQPGPGAQFEAEVRAVTTAGYVVRPVGWGSTHLVPRDAALRAVRLAPTPAAEDGA
jgi:hypothetical protein